MKKFICYTLLLLLCLPTNSTLLSKSSSIYHPIPQCELEIKDK